MELIFFLFGLVVGSFLNVCIYRIPRSISIIKPLSFCPTCGNPIKPWHNIPILSFLFLKGKCAYCKTKISLRYPVVEVINGILYLFSYITFGLNLSLFFIFFFVSSLIVISFIDIDFQIIPDVISIPLIFSGIVLSLVNEEVLNLASDIKDSLLGVLIGGGVLLLVSIVSKGGMGGGDIKLNAAVGAYLGWKSALLTLFLGSLIGAVVGLIVLKKTGSRKIPFGPFLSIGAMISLFFGNYILNWYLG